MPRYIDLDKLSTHKFTTQEASHNDMGGAYRQGWNDAIDAVVDNEPTADVVEVVRCKDCKYFDTGYCGIPFIGKKVNSNHYCSFGERKEESGNEDDIQPHVCSTCHWCLNDWHQEPCNICAHGSKWKDGR